MGTYTQGTKCLQVSGGAADSVQGRPGRVPGCLEEGPPKALNKY